uniref:Uncharacterized protein n=1 Tax=Arundo donax TaxID=35708 RepID=A0A0A8YLN8_ARUDO
MHFVHKLYYLQLTMLLAINVYCIILKNKRIGAWGGKAPTS